ncbi:similar to Saccharomyces cerevisiae YER130C Protein of unknown function [Maudiozyma saulgeensis]|uniref:C2H2-type domain-containing protein n=1 Tax=Maudiozyma saulgeensis TaxID=1789683 RepID=A0A1X7R1E9_9SACH|nr:similar to Saccharomyces cerevisiae YER130C Protein of unknown function [Kazachstania saulgeensis]
MNFDLERSNSTSNFLINNKMNTNNTGYFNNNGINYNFNLQLIPKDENNEIVNNKNNNNNTVNNDLTGNTLTNDIDPPFQFPPISNNKINDGRRLSISNYNFGNANYYEYEDFEMNLKLDNNNNNNNNNNAITNNEYIEQSKQLTYSSTGIRQLPLTHHEIDLENYDTNNEIVIDDNQSMENETDIDMIDNDISDIPFDSITSTNTTNNHNATITGKRRMRDYFKFNLFNSNNNNNGNSVESEILLKNDENNSQLNDQFSLKKKSFWNPKNTPFLRRYNSKNKDEENEIDDINGITKELEFSDLFDIDMPLSQEFQTSTVPINTTTSLPSQQKPMFKNELNPMIIMDQPQQITGVNPSYTFDNVSTVNSSVNISSPVMTIAPSLVTNDDISSSMVQPIKSMNPFEQDIMNYYDISNNNNNNNNNPVEQSPIVIIKEDQQQDEEGEENMVESQVSIDSSVGDITRSETPIRHELPQTIKRRASNTVPKTRGRKPSLIPDASKQFCCDYCDRRFKRQEHLKRHIRSLHICEKPFTCHICQKNFSRSDNLNQHIKTHAHDEE